MRRRWRSTPPPKIAGAISFFLFSILGLCDGIDYVGFGPCVFMMDVLLFIADDVNKKVKSLLFLFFFSKGGRPAAHSPMGRQVSVCLQNVGQRIDRCPGAVPFTDIRPKGM